MYSFTSRRPVSSRPFPLSKAVVEPRLDSSPTEVVVVAPNVMHVPPIVHSLISNLHIMSITNLHM